MHEFILLIDGKQKTFHNYEDIPEKFQHVIKFSPEIPEGPHTEEQHTEINSWNSKLQLLMKKEHEFKKDLFFGEWNVG
jgi:hypothetical protein